MRKHRLFRGLLVAMLLLGVGLLLRFVPGVNDALSGRPRYMQIFAAAMGRQIAQILRGGYPILIRPRNTTDCRTVNQSGAPDSDDALYVLAYSEESRSICLSVYAILREGAKSTDLETFTVSNGESYGREVSGTIRAVPLHRSLTVLSPEYLALLHWRAKVDPAAFVNAGKSQRVTSPSAQINFADASISFVELRAEVARRHELVNRVLIAAILLIFATFVLFLAKLIALYRRAAEQCRSYDFELGFLDFLKKDFPEIGKAASALYQQRRQQLLGEMRLENTLRRERQETRLRLEALLSAEEHGDQRLRILRALENDDLDHMQTLLQELQPHVLQKGPEERLRLLLESLKEYCTDEELTAVERRIFDLLQQEGFRSARRSVIQFHDHYRVRAKEAADAQEKRKSAEEHCSTSETSE